MHLVARNPDGHPVAKDGIDYAATPGVGTVMQPATIAELQGLGIAAHLIAIAESHIRSRGVHVAELGAEEDNPRARALYKRLGYEEAGRRRASWEVDDEDDKVSRYETELVILTGSCDGGRSRLTARARKDGSARFRPRAHASSYSLC